MTSRKQDDLPIAAARPVGARSPGSIGTSRRFRPNTPAISRGSSNAASTSSRNPAPHQKGRRADLVGRPEQGPQRGHQYSFRTPAYHGSIAPKPAVHRKSGTDGDPAGSVVHRECTERPHRQSVLVPPPHGM